MLEQNYKDNISHMYICNNCRYFLGGVAWGLSCAKNYYIIADSLNKACDKFEKKPFRKDS